MTFLRLLSGLTSIKRQYWMIWIFYIKKEFSKHLVGE